MRIKNSRAYIMLLSVAAIWGFASPIIKFGFHVFPPDIFLTYRFLLTVLVMLPMLAFSEPKTFRSAGRLVRENWRVLLIAGIFGSTFQLGFLFWGLNLTTSLDASLINAASPIMSALAGVYFLKEKLSRRMFWGYITAFAGTAFIVLQPVFEGTPLFSGGPAGNLLVLLGTFAWVIYVIMTKLELNHKLSALFLTTSMFVVGAVSMTAITLFLHTPAQIVDVFASSDLASHLSIIYMALLSGALAYFLYQKAQSMVTVSQANLFLYLSPLFSFPLAYFWLHEQASIYFYAGAVTIAAGVVIAETKNRNKRSNP